MFSPPPVAPPAPPDWFSLSTLSRVLKGDADAGAAAAPPPPPPNAVVMWATVVMVCGVALLLLERGLFRKARAAAAAQPVAAAPATRKDSPKGRRRTSKPKVPEVDVGDDGFARQAAIDSGFEIIEKEQ